MVPVQHPAPRREGGGFAASHRPEQELFPLEVSPLQVWVQLSVDAGVGGQEPALP